MATELPLDQIFLEFLDVQTKIIFVAMLLEPILYVTTKKMAETSMRHILLSGSTKICRIPLDRTIHA